MARGKKKPVIPLVWKLSEIWFLTENNVAEGLTMAVDVVGAEAVLSKLADGEVDDFHQGPWRQ